MSKIKKIFLLSLLLIGIVSVGCVKSDIFAGNIIIPDSQLMGTYTDSSVTVKTSTIKIDSIITSSAGVIYVGRYNSPIFGTMTTSGASTFFTPAFSDTLRYFGKNPVADSMKMQLVITNTVGDSNYPVSISVHSILDSTLKLYSSYYSNRSMEGRYDPNPIVTVDFPRSDTSIIVNMPASFYNELLVDYTDYEHQADNFYREDSLFFEKFKGFYFKVNNLAPVSQEGQVASLELQYSFMELFYRGTFEDDEIDTTSQQFLFYNADLTLGNHYSILEYDYSTADVSQGGVDASLIGDSLQNTSRVFIQGLGGLGSRIEIDTLAIDKIKEKADSMGFRTVALHSAKLSWKIVPTILGGQLSPQTYNFATKRLGLFENYMDYSFIPEYNPYDEITYGENVTLFGGYINRSQGVYEQNIAKTMQKLFQKPDDIYYSQSEDYIYIMEVFVEMTNMGFYSEVILGGGASKDNSPELSLIYTFIR